MITLQELENVDITITEEELNIVNLIATVKGQKQRFIDMLYSINQTPPFGLLDEFY